MSAAANIVTAYSDSWLLVRSRRVNAGQDTAARTLAPQGPSRFRARQRCRRLGMAMDAKHCASSPDISHEIKDKICSIGQLAPPKADSYPARSFLDRSRLISRGQRAFAIA